MVLKRASVLRGSGRLPKSWTALDIPIEELASLARRVVRARQAGKSSRPWVQVGKALQRRILRMPFQSSEQVRRAMSLCGKSKVWEQVGKKLGSNPAELQRT